MKNNIFRWLSIFVMAAVCVGFASCGDDDDDVKPGGGPDSGIAVKFQGPKRVFGNNLLKSYGAEYGNRYELVYNSDDFVKKIIVKEKDGEIYREYDVTYSDNNVIVAQRNSNGKVKHITFTIGSNGFASKSTGLDGDMTQEYEYDSEGHLTRLRSGGFRGWFTWQNGNIVEQGDNDSSTSRTFTYSSLGNVAGLYIKASIGGDMGDFYDDIFYYIGLLGKGTQNLVKTYVSNSSSYYGYSKSGENTWTLDAVGRPTKCVTITTETSNQYGTSSSYTGTYVWNYR